jgi:unsaturated rhamnogalacturonyl hydrolase
LKSAGEVAGAPPDLWSATNLLLQKLPAESFTATTLVDPGSMRAGEQAGLVVMGVEYATLHIEKRKTGLAITQGTEEKYTAVQPIQLRVAITPEAIARFSYSEDGNRFLPLGKAFVARPGRWIGAKVGLFGPAEFDWFRVAETQPAERASLVVAQDGSADYRTVQEAVDAIPGDNSVNRTILIRNGVYREKVLLNKPYVSLVGEDREKTRIEFAQLRRLWREKHPDDYGASVVNIGPDATDIVIANLSVVNDYGRKNGGENDHQFAIRSMPFSNRIAILNVNAIADGGDTVSLWNSETGMSYYADSYFEGHVDYLCPRGWAYVTNSRFFGHNHNASIWHDGSKNEDQKLVIRNSHFDGVPNFALGRNHRDAQFYLLDVRFSETMADKPIYAANAPDPRLWGPRYYYANAGGRFAWAADNLHTAKGAPREEDITPEWTFNNQWDPATLPAVLPFAAIPRPEHASKWIKPTGTTLRWTRGRNATKSRVHFGETNPPTFRAETIGTSFETGPLEPDKTYYWRVDSGAPPTPAAIVEGKLWSFKTDARSTRIALAGDSTMTEKSGYGKGFKSHVAQTAAVLNLARGGRSSKSFRNEGHWDELLKQKPTHVLIQFGHNDQPGKGLDRETDMASYKANLARYVDEARAISAQPILVTPLTRRNYSEDGRIRTDLEAYAETTRQVAAEKKAPLIDLHGKSIELLNSLGPAVSPALGPIKTDGTLDKTHLNDTGSALVGALMAQEVRRVVPELAPHIREAKTPAVNPPWSVRMADSEMKRTPDPMLLDSTNGRPRWEYTPGLVLKSILHVAQRTGDERYYKYVKAYYDGMINAEGEIAGGYKLEDYNIDRINPGKPLFDLYAKMKDEKYRKAIELLRKQMREHPRTKEGGFWHKKRYPWQMWLDGLYMGAPFLAQYAVTFNEPALLDDMVTQFVLMEKNARDAKTGLLFHGWDESRQQKWADKETGRSPEFWGRAMGWYAMGLVETLDFVPANHRRRGELVAILNRLAEAVVKVQDPKTGVWWQVIDKGGREGNYLESSVSAMLSFALQKAARLRIIDAKYGEAGRRAYQGILKEFIEVDKEGLTNIHKVCQVAGLGGDPEKGEKYRSGTFEYYISEPIRSNDPKGVGPFIFASQEYELR